MSTPVSITDLLNAIGSDNIKIQYLTSCLEGIKSAKGRNLVTFGTDAITPSDAVFNTGPRGLIIWVDGDLMHQRMEELKAGQGETIEKVQQQRDKLAEALESVIMAGTSGSRGMRNFLAEAKKALDEVRGVRGDA